MRFGIDYGGTNIKTGLFDEQGRIVRFEENKLSRFLSDGDLLDNLVLFSQEFIGREKITRGGLAIKGLVDSEAGSIIEDIGAGELLAGKDLTQPFQDALQIPFIIENDARAYAFGEWLFGAGKGSDLMVCMTLGTGIGCAVIERGKSYRGADIFGGLLGGHLTIDRNGPECSCGQRGCLEGYCSAPAIKARCLEKHPEIGQSDEPLVRFFEEVRNGNESLTATLDEIIDDLALGIVNIIHAYNPQLVVIGGGVMQSSDLILPKLKEQVSKRAWTWPRGKVQIKAAALGNRAAALGVAFHPEYFRKGGNAA